MEIKNVTIGSDPEVFIFDTHTKNFISAEGLIGGDKHNPNPISKLPAGFFEQEDNVMVEFCIPPATTAKQFTDNIFIALDYFNDKVKSINSNYIIMAQPSADFEWKYLNTKQGQHMGCDPDYNVWKKEVNVSPDGKLLSWRSAGGHIHIGHDDPENLDKNMAIIKVMDLYLGVSSILLDKDKRRKEIYGKAGSFRFKHYGVEYRTLSNFFLSNREYCEKIASLTLQGINDFNKSNDLLDKIEKHSDMIINCINSYNTNEANYLIDLFKINVYESVNS